MSKSSKQKKVTKKQVLEMADEFWKNFGHATLYRTKKEYIKYVLENYKMYKKQGNKFMKERTPLVEKDLKIRAHQVGEYIKEKKKLDKIDEAVAKKMGIKKVSRGK